MLERMVKSAMLSASGYKRLLDRARHLKFDVSLQNKLRMWARGFCADNYVLYDFKSYRRKDYLSDYRMYVKAVKINADYAVALNNKLLFSYLIRALVRTPEVYSLLNNGRLFPVHMEVSIANIDDLVDVCRSQEALVLKPVVEGGGVGVRKLERRGNQLLMNGRPVDIQELRKAVARLDGYLICEFIEQGEYARNIYPDTTNTIKVQTMIDSVTLEPFIPIAAHRFGCPKSFPVDSLTQGGVCAEVNAEDGTLGRAGITRNGRLTWHDNHPDTKVRIKGIRIPRWHNVRDSILQLAKILSFIRYIAWDIVIQDEGFTVIEGNANGNLDLFQMHRPLLSDPRVRAFYKHHRVIRGHES